MESPFELIFLDFVDFGLAESDKRGLGADHNLAPQLVIVCAALVIVCAALVQRICQQDLAQLRNDLPKILKKSVPKCIYLLDKTHYILSIETCWRAKCTRLLYISSALGNSALAKRMLPILL